jgi:hypothetical protein
VDDFILLKIFARSLALYVSDIDPDTYAVVVEDENEEGGLVLFYTVPDFGRREEQLEVFEEDWSLAEIEGLSNARAAANLLGNWIGQWADPEEDPNTPNEVPGDPEEEEEEEDEEHLSTN